MRREGGVGVEDGAGDDLNWGFCSLAFVVPSRVAQLKTETEISFFLQK